MARRIDANVAAKAEVLEELKMVNFTWPTTTVSLLLAVLLLSCQQSFLAIFGELLAKGYVLWIAGGIATVAELVTYFLSLRVKLSLRHLVTAGVLVSAAWAVTFASQGIFHTPYIPPAGPPSTHALVEQLTQWYFTLVIATFIACPLLIGLVEAAGSLFGGDSENRPTPLPTG